MLHLELVRTEDVSRKSNLFAICCVVSWISACVIFFVVAVAHSSEVLVSPFATSLGYAALVGVSVFLIGVYNSSLHILISENDVKLHSRVLIAQSLTSNLGKIVFGFALPTATVIIGSYISSIAFAIALAFSLNGTLRCFSKEYTGKFSNLSQLFQNARSAVSKQKELAVYRTAQEIIFNLSQFIPFFVFVYLDELILAGSYTMIRSLVYIPTMLFGKPINDIGLPLIKKYVAERRSIKMIVLWPPLISLLLLIPCVLFFHFVGEKFFFLLLGEGWSAINNFALPMVIVGLGGIANKTCIAAITIYGFQKMLFRWEVINASLKVLFSVLICICFQDSIMVVWCVSLISVFMYSILILSTLKKIR